MDIALGNQSKVSGMLSNFKYSKFRFGKLVH
jgi:hypothetical protein